MVRILLLKICEVAFGDLDGIDQGFEPDDLNSN